MSMLRTPCLIHGEIAESGHRMYPPEDLDYADFDVDTLLAD